MTVAVARADDAESLHLGPSTMRLLLDSDATGGALSAHRVRLADGALGASPHRHTGSSEAFFVLAGSVDLLTGDRLTTATEGDLLVVPPGTAHAFAASTGHTAELLVMITPGIARFSFFRELVAVANGVGDRDAFLDGQGRYDTYPADDDLWRTRA